MSASCGATPSTSASSEAQLVGQACLFSAGHLGCAAMFASSTATLLTSAAIKHYLLVRHVLVLQAMFASCAASPPTPATMCCLGMGRHVFYTAGSGLGCQICIMSSKPINICSNLITWGGQTQAYGAALRLCRPSGLLCQACAM